MRESGEEGRREGGRGVKWKKERGVGKGRKWRRRYLDFEVGSG